MLEFTKELARSAGEIIRRGYGKKIAIEYKGGLNNLVTEVDRATEEFIINSIRGKFKDHSILSEESGSLPSNPEYLWVIDPLDGTTNFAHGLPVFSVSIGLIKNNEIILGVIYDVMRDQLFWAEKGKGAFLNGHRIEVRKNSDIRMSLLVTGFPYQFGEAAEKIIGLFSSFLLKARAVRRLGSSAIDLCYLACGIFDGFWEYDLKPWDLCAGILIVEEAGGMVSDFSGGKADIYGHEILASNGFIHPEMIKIIKG